MDIGEPLRVIRHVPAEAPAPAPVHVPAEPAPLAEPVPA